MTDRSRNKSFCPNLTRGEYLLFQELIGQASGLRLEERDWTPLRAALCERLAAVGGSGFGEYYELLRSREGSQEMGLLIELLTVHETAFFRNRGHFDVLTSRVIPVLMERKAASRSIRVWSAGCSTGQEAYSIAISLMETVPDVDSWRIEVLATDISHRALEQARNGIYPARAVRNVDPVLLDRYFEPWEGGYRVAGRVRDRVRFEYLNLVKEPFPLSALSPMDAIFCENVTIYFKVESTRRVIRNFYETLTEGGYLFLGYSETLWQISNDFALKEMDGTFIYQRPLASEDGAEGEVNGGTSGRNAARLGTPPRRPAFLSPKRVAVPASPRRRAATLEEAASLYEGKRFEEALLTVEGVLADEPGNSEAHLLAAKLRADREEVGPALRHCRRVLDSNPLLEEAHYLLGILQMRSGDADGAMGSLLRVIYLNPVGHRAALAHFHLGGLQVEAGRWEEAAREYRGAVRLLECFAKDELIEEFSADFLARVCRRRLEELGRV